MALNNGRYHIRCCSYHFILGIQDNGYLNFSSIFYKKEMINDANSSGHVAVRILDENRNIILDEIIVDAGESISLKVLEDNMNYIVEVKCKEGRYFLNFI